MQQAPENRSRISVVILALDEQLDLTASIECVESFADEIVVGIVYFPQSTSAAPENEHRSIAKTLHIPWQHDIASARNACLESATGDWLLWLDAGEILTAETAEQIKNFIDTGADPSHVYRLMLRTAEHDHQGQQSVLQIAQHRLLPNGKGLHFTGPVRESLEASIAACRLESEQLNIAIMQTPDGRAAESRLKTARRNLRICEQILTETTTEPSLWLARGEALADLGEWETAEQAFNQARQFAAEGSAELLEAYYGALRAMDHDPNQKDEQLNLCMEALKKFPVDVQLLCTMGHYLHCQQRIDLATRAYQTAVRYGKVHPASWHLAEIAAFATVCLGISLELEDRSDEAREMLEDALIEQPTSFRIRHQLIDLHVRHGRRKEAVEQVGRLPDQWPHRDAFANAVRGACLAESQNWANAEAYLQTAFDAGCRDVICLRWLLLTHAALEHFGAAQETLEQWRAIDPENPEVQKWTASLLTRKFSQTTQAVATSPGTALPPHFSVSQDRKKAGMAEVKSGATTFDKTKEIS